MELTGRTGLAGFGILWQRESGPRRRGSDPEHRGKETWCGLTERSAKESNTPPLPHGCGSAKVLSGARERAAGLVRRSL
jgi:hypothetical protein